MTIEYRDAGGTATASEGVLNGLVTPFNVWTTIGDVKRGGFRERIAPGTFAKTLQERDVVLINAHDTSQPMARTSILDGVGSLALTEDASVGLRARAVPVDTSYARDVMACADAGVTRGMSFGFEVIKDAWTDDNGNPSDAMRGTQRTIHEVRLFECTTTAFPAYDTTTLSARDLVAAARESRAAVASYSDLNTCGECGATSQYDSFCTGCGAAMNEPPAQGGFCGACGTDMGDERSAHVCTVKRDAEVRADHTCPSCGNTFNSPANPGPDGDSDSDADDQAVSRSSEPAETTRDEDSVLYAAALRAFHGI